LNQVLADAVLILHVAVVAFVVGGLVLIVVGYRRAWQWVGTLWFRLAHLAAIAVVAAEAWLGVACPLTTLEMRLRSGARGDTYDGGFVEHWLQRVLYYDAPAWVFVLGYTLFGLAVVAAWFCFPPKYNRHVRQIDARRTRPADLHRPTSPADLPGDTPDFRREGNRGHPSGSTG
jgi:Protein of Unknown function (DUF2784)